jgi:hypothetical protein
MSVLDFVAKMSASLAWPLAVLGLVFLLRKEIRTLLGKVSSLKFKDFELALAKDFASAQEESTKALGGRSAEPADPRLGRYAKLVAVAPKTVIIENWRRIEEAASQLLIDRGRALGDADFRRPIGIVDALREEGLVDEETHAIVRNMYLLRNKVVHYEPLVVSSADARTYYENSLKLLKIIEEIGAAPRRRSPRARTP